MERGQDPPPGELFVKNSRLGLIFITLALGGTRTKSSNLSRAYRGMGRRAHLIARILREAQIRFVPDVKMWYLVLEDTMM